MSRHLVSAALTALCICGSVASHADDYQHGYFRRDGTYVAPHYRSDPNETITNNFSFRGSVMPYTGKVSTNRYDQDIESPYYEGPDGYAHIGHEDPAPGRLDVSPYDEDTSDRD